MSSKIQIITILIFSIISCSPKTKEGALKKYGDLIENKTWCEIKSKDRIIFKNGFCKKSFDDDSLINIGEYILTVKPKHGLTNKWHMPDRTIEIKTKSGNTYSFELKVNSNENLIVFRNRKDKTTLFLSDNCILNASDSIPFLTLKEHNYKMIDLK